MANFVEVSGGNKFQREIAHRISHAYKSIDNIQKKLFKLQNLKSAISSDLLSGLKRVSV